MRDGQPKWRSDRGAVLEYWQQSSMGAAWWWVAPGGKFICAARCEQALASLGPPAAGWEDYQGNLRHPHPSPRPAGPAQKGDDY